MPEVFFSSDSTSVTFGEDIVISADAPVVIGGIPPSGTLNITANGTYNVSAYASADVAVPEVHTAEDGLVTGEYSGEYTNARVTSIKAYAFVANVDMTYVSMPNVNDMISNYAFSGCTGLEGVNFPSVKRIGQYAFRNCSSLENATFSGITNIYTYAFQNCTALEWVAFEDITEVPTLANANAFTGCSSLTALYFPDALVDTAKGTTNWTSFSSIIKPLSQKPSS